MRSSASLALAFVLLACFSVAMFAPPAAAQVTMSPLETPIRPLGPAAQIPITVDTDCPPDAAASGVQVAYAVSRAPPWAQVVVSPASDHKDYASCAGGRALFHAIASVTVTADAPAFTPESLEITVRLPNSALGGGGTARTNVPIVAAFFSVIDAQAVLAQRTAAPREIVSFPVKFTNLGNGNTKILFDTSEHDAGVYPAAPPPLLLSSRQSGGSSETASQLVNLQAYRLANATGVSQFVLRYHASYALDGALKGDEGALTFRLLPRSAGAPADEREAATPASDAAPSPLDKFAPGPSLPLALVPLGIAAVVFGRRRA